MGLFDKKYCDVCGQKIGLLGNRKLEDGNLCKDCAKKLSPFFSERKQSTVAEIKEQLAYREANKERVAAFNPTKTIGGSKTIYFDEEKQQIIITSARNWRDENPDVIDYSQITGCDLNVKENRTEIYREDKDGNKVSFNPKRYNYTYDFFISIFVNSPYFNTISYQLNNVHINSAHSPEYAQMNRNADEIKNTLSGVRQEFRNFVQEQIDARKPIVCPYCNATTFPDENGLCEYCGAPVRT